MRVLFVIPKAEQPLLEGNYSSSFKDFVACCTHKDPLARPSAAQLLKHSFLKARFIDL
jgi:serine/threonine-protein kinase 24/25/MST4